MPLVLTFFLILFVLKILATQLVYYGGPLAGLVVILACYFIARRIEPTFEKPERPAPRVGERGSF